MKRLLCLIIQLSSLSTATAEIYKCHHANKQISYTDRPCVATQSETLAIKSLPTSLASKIPRTEIDSQTNHSFLSKQDQQLLQQINRREQRQNKREQWKEKQRYKLKLKQAAQRKKTRKQKCRKHKKRLYKLKNKARNGYKASESNRLYENIRRYKKSVATYCR